MQYQHGTHPDMQSMFLKWRRKGYALTAEAKALTPMPQTNITIRTCMIAPDAMARVLLPIGQKQMHRSNAYSIADQKD